MNSFTSFEVIDTTYTGRTTMRINLDGNNGLALFSHYRKTVADGTSLTVGDIMAYAAHVWSALVWTQTDAGERTAIKYDQFTCYLYR